MFYLKSDLSFELFKKVFEFFKKYYGQVFKNLAEALHSLGFFFFFLKAISRIKLAPLN